MWELICGFYSHLVRTAAMYFYFPQGSFFHVRQFKVRISHLRFSQEELKVSAAKDAVVLNVAREVHGAGAVYCAVNLHVAVNDVQVLLLVLKNKWGGNEADQFKLGSKQHSNANLFRLNWYNLETKSPLLQKLFE